MTGSSIATVVIPVVGTIALATWMIMVFHADSARAATDQDRSGIGNRFDS